MTFEIRDKDGNKVSIDQLNIDASVLWDKDVVFYEREEIYTVSPTEDLDDGWQQVIGMVIENPTLLSDLTGRKVMQQDWNDIRQSLLNVQMQEQELFDEGSLFGWLHRALIYLQPYYDLIDIWEGQGYTPVRIP